MLTLLHGSDFITIREGRVILFALTTTEAVDTFRHYLTGIALGRTFWSIEHPDGDPGSFFQGLSHRRLRSLMPGELLKLAERLVKKHRRSADARRSYREAVRYQWRRPWTVDHVAYRRSLR